MGLVNDTVQFLAECVCEVKVSAFSSKTVLQKNLPCERETKKKGEQKNENRELVRNNAGIQSKEMNLPTEVTVKMEGR